jgi:cytochrome c oxidase subunit 2
MTALIIFGCFILVGLVVFQMSKINEMIKRIKGEEAALEQSNNNTAWALLAFMIVFLVATVYSAYHYKNFMLGYGPLLPASEHASYIDGLFNVTSMGYRYCFYYHAHPFILFCLEIQVHKRSKGFIYAT